MGSILAETLVQVTNGTMTVCFPFEILNAIFEQVNDVKDLRNIRTVSHTFCAVVTPIAFCILSIKSTAENTPNLGWLNDVPEIAAYIREVTYHDMGVKKWLMPEQLKPCVSSHPLIPW